MKLDEIVPEYNSKNPLVKKLFYDRIKYALFFSKIRNSQEILDIGTGNGILIRMLRKKFPKNNYTGIDMHRGIRNLEIPDTKLLVADVRKLPFKSNTFDRIFCLDVLEHIKELDKAISEIKRVMKDDGILVVSMPQESWIYKTARFFLKGTFSQEKGPCASPHYWNAKQLMKRLGKFFMLKKHKKLFPAFTLFHIASYGLQ
jgi:ubiquinone/menaquinone biosynthesis C-methylase UbiE